MPKSYMIKRYRKKGGFGTDVKNVQHRNIQDFSTADSFQSDSCKYPNQVQHKGSNIDFKPEEEGTKQHLLSVNKLQQKSTDDYYETIPVFGQSNTNPISVLQHQRVPLQGAPIKPIDYRSHQGILSGFRNIFHHAQTVPLHFKPTSDVLIHCGLPDNISPKSATSAIESPTFPTDASVPPHWSHSYLPTIKTEIFNFDPKVPDHISVKKPDEYHKYTGHQYGVSAKYCPEHIPVLPTDKSVTRQKLNDNPSPISNRYDPIPRYFHDNTNDEKDPIGQYPTDKALTFSPLNMFCNFPMYKSNADVELNAVHKPNSIPSKSIELVNGGYGMTNPAIAPFVINSDTVKAKQSNMIYACQVCGLIFPKPKHLTKHITKTHDKIKKYLCRFCHKGFNDKFDLKRHTRTHTGIKPFECDICSKRFTQRCSLEAHRRKVHSKEVGFEHRQRREKMHICEECGSTTKDPFEHFVHIKQNHPDSALLSKFHDKRQFKSTDTKSPNE